MDIGAVVDEEVDFNYLEVFRACAHKSLMENILENARNI